MSQKYEYKFIRLGKGALWARSEAEENYKKTIYQYSKEGWRLVQIFSPSIGIYGWSRYYKVILERLKKTTCEIKLTDFKN